jgi:DNA-binding NarL/FixJ family response regulator
LTGTDELGYKQFCLAGGALTANYLMNPVRILVVDDHPFFRTGVIAWIQQQHGLVCCGEADSVESAWAAVSNLSPDLVLLDLDLPDGNGLELASEIARINSKVRMIVLSHADEHVFAHRALRAGARGYIMKSEAPIQVMVAIETVMRGEIYVSRAISAQLLHRLFPDPSSTGLDLARLSDREIQVFQLLGAGYRSGEIAEKLKISPKTVDTYRENLKQKLSLPHANDLVRAATRWVQKGELPDDDGKASKLR